jgi:hypothetical protein
MGVKMRFFARLTIWIPLLGSAAFEENPDVKQDPKMSDRIDNAPKDFSL